MKNKQEVIKLSTACAACVRMYVPEKFVLQRKFSIVAGGRECTKELENNVK